MTLIGLRGRKNSGKDTVYGLLLDLEPHLVRISTGDLIKEEVAAGYGVSVDCIEQHKEVFRLVLQGWGDARRALWGEDYFLKKHRERLLIGQAVRAPLAVFTDVRLPNEFHWVKSNGGVMVHIVGRGKDGDPHVTETALEGFQFDYGIDNSNSVDHLKAAVHQLYEQIKGPRPVHAG